MSKKSTPEKGLPSVTIDFDKPRTLKWNNEQTRRFEEWVLPYLDFPKSGIKRGVPTADNPTGLISMSAQYAVMNALTTTTIQTRAIYHALQAENPDLDSFEVVDDLITAYKASGQSWDDLMIAVQRSFLLANDPSFLSSQEERWKALRKLSKITEAVEAKRQEKAKREMEEQIAKMERRLEEFDSGKTPPASPTA